MAALSGLCAWCGYSEEDVGPLVCRTSFQGLTKLPPETLCICRGCVAGVNDLFRDADAQPVAPDAQGDLIADAQMRQPRVVAVGERHELMDGRRRLVTSVELWPWRVVVRWLENAPRGRLRDHGRWRLNDDCGTRYHGVGSGAGGDAAWIDGEARFEPAVPPEATRLTVITPEGPAITFDLPDV